MITWTRLHDVDALPAPRHIAYALADLGRPQLERARVYIEERRALEAAGVPPKFCRELLDERLPEAEPLTAVRAWDGSTAPIMLVGDVGTAKSHALGCWLLARHRRGQLTHWESVPEWGRLTLDELADREKSLATKAGLVLDDVGAGKLYDPHRRTLEGLLLSRHAAELPTAIAMNVRTRKDLHETFGRRALDRIAREGGRVVILESKKSLRRPPPAPTEGDGHRRSTQHLDHLWLLDVVGCVMVGRGLDGGVYEETPAFGDKLAAHLARPGWLDEAERVRDRLGLRVVDVVDVATNLAREAETDPMARLADEVLGKMRSKSEQASAERAAAQRSSSSRRTSPARRDDPSTRATDTQPRGPAGCDERGVPDRKKLAAMGFSTRPSYDGLVLEFGKGEDRRLMATRCGSEADAWECAARLLGTLEPAASVSMADANFRTRQLPDASDARRRRAEVSP